MRTHTRLSAVAAIAVVGLALAACSGTPTSDSTGTTSDSTDGATEGAPEGATTVVFWQQAYTAPEDEWYATAIEAFNESQDEVFVDHEVVPFDAWEQRMTAAQAAGTAPDVYTMSYGNIRSAVSNGRLTDVSDLVSAEAWDDVTDNILDFVTVEGRQYAYPLLVEPSAVLWYRSSMFDEAGLDGPPESWADLVEYAKALSTADRGGIRLATVAGDMGWSTWGLQYNVAGKLPISDDWSTAEATDAYAPLLQLFQDLFASGALPPADGAGYTDSAAFGEGKYAMMVNGSWAAGQLLADYPDAVDDIKVAAVPTYDGAAGETTATLGGWTLVVDGQSKVPEAAAAFIEGFLGGDPETVADFFAATAYSKVAARDSVAEVIAADPAAAEANPWNATIQADIVPYAAAEPTYPWNISLAMGTAIEAAMQGASISEALATANATIQTEIDNNGLAGTGS